MLKAGKKVKKILDESQARGDAMVEEHENNIINGTLSVGNIPMKVLKRLIAIRNSIAPINGNAAITDLKKLATIRDWLVRKNLGDIIIRPTFNGFKVVLDIYTESEGSLLFNHVIQAEPNAKFKSFKLKAVKGEKVLSLISGSTST